MIPSQIYKLKQQWDTTPHISEWLKSGPLIKPNAGKDVENRNTHPLLGGMQKDAGTLGRQFGSFYKTMYVLTIGSRSTFCYLHKGVETFVFP